MGSFNRIGHWIFPNPKRLW